MSNIEKLETLLEMINFSNATRTEQAKFFASQLKRNVCVTNNKTWFVFSDEKKLFIEQN